MVNDNGRCYPFDSRGAGYGRAEGVAVLVLKRLQDARRDGDAVRAIIRNSGANQDGKTNGILLPNSHSQQQLAESLCRQVGIAPQDVTYVEAHGTGTQAGDAAELESLKAVFDGDAERKHPVYLGSIKANIGHTECTSGLAGVIKTVLALEKGVIPPVAELNELKSSVRGRIEGSNIIVSCAVPRPASLLTDDNADTAKATPMAA
jgi:acyl transferase domain-containing protein